MNNIKVYTPVEKNFVKRARARTMNSTEYVWAKAHVKDSTRSDLRLRTKCERRHQEWWAAWAKERSEQKQQNSSVLKKRTAFQSGSQDHSQHLDHNIWITPGSQHNKNDSYANVAASKLHVSGGSCIVHELHMTTKLKFFSIVETTQELPGFGGGGGEGH